MTATATLLTIPDQSARTERQLRAAWDAIDAAKAGVRALEAKARPLEKAMARSLGYGDFTRREALERALRRKPRQSDASMKLAVGMIDQMKGEAK